MEKKKIELSDGKFSNDFDSIVNVFINELNAIEFTKDARVEFIKRIKAAAVVEKPQPKKKLTLEELLAIIDAEI